MKTTDCRCWESGLQLDQVDWRLGRFHWALSCSICPEENYSGLMFPVCVATPNFQHLRLISPSCRADRTTEHCLSPILSCSPTQNIHLWSTNTWRWLQKKSSRFISSSYDQPSTTQKRIFDNNKQQQKKNNNLALFSSFWWSMSLNLKAS